MPAARQSLSVLVAALATARAAFGPAFSTGPTASGVYIKSSTATLVVPNAPSNNAGDLSLWVGMGTSAGDLIQSIVETYQSTSWNSYAYTLKETSPTSQEAIYGQGSATTPAGSQVKMNYAYNSATGNYTQTVYLNGAVVSTLSTSDGYAEGWGSAVECAATNCGTVPAHEWIDVQIVMSAADPTYINTLSLGSGVSASMTTSDGGVTWNVGTIKIPQFSF